MRFLLKQKLWRFKTGWGAIWCRGSTWTAHSSLKCSMFTEQITATVSPAKELLGSVSILQIGERLEDLLWTPLHGLLHLQGSQTSGGTESSVSPLGDSDFCVTNFWLVFGSFSNQNTFRANQLSQIRVCDDDDDDGDFIQPEISNKKAVCSEGLERSRF